MKKGIFLGIVIILIMGCGLPQGTVKGVGNEGLLKIIATPEDAIVYVDGIKAGEAQDFNGKPGLLKLTSGTHVIELKAEGYDPYRREVYSSNNSLHTIEATLSKKE